jgi:hypothetical protein
MIIHFTNSVDLLACKFFAMRNAADAVSALVWEPPEGAIFEKGSEHTLHL